MRTIIIVSALASLIVIGAGCSTTSRQIAVPPPAAPSAVEPAPVPPGTSPNYYR